MTTNKEAAAAAAASLTDKELKDSICAYELDIRDGIKLDSTDKLLLRLMKAEAIRRDL
jgi:hypothetical protein